MPAAGGAFDRAIAPRMPQRLQPRSVTTCGFVSPRAGCRSNSQAAVQGGVRRVGDGPRTARSRGRSDALGNLTQRRERIERCHQYRRHDKDGAEVCAVLPALTARDGQVRWRRIDSGATGISAISWIPSGTGSRRATSGRIELKLRNGGARGLLMTAHEQARTARAGMHHHHQLRGHKHAKQEATDRAPKCQSHRHGHLCMSRTNSSPPRASA